MEDLFKSLSAIYYSSKLCGVACFKYAEENGQNVFKKCKISIVYGSVLSIINILYLIYVYDINATFLKSDDGILRLVYYIQIQIGAVFIFSVLTGNYLHSENYVFILNKLLDIDKELHLQGISINYMNAFYFSIRIILQELCCFAIMTSIILCYSYSSLSYNYLYVINIFLHMCVRVCFLSQFRVMTLIIRERFILLNINLNKHIDLKNLNSTSFTNTFKVTAKLHRALCKLFRKTNNIFAFTLLTFYAHALIVLLTHMYNICYYIASHNRSSAEETEYKFKKLPVSFFWVSYYAYYLIHFSKLSFDLTNSVSTCN